MKKRKKKSSPNRMHRNNIPPRAGFIYPEVGDKIQVLVAYPATVNERIIILPVDEEGTVLEVQKPDASKGLAVGCHLYFKSIYESEHSPVHITWDVASDPARFKFTDAKAVCPDTVISVSNEAPSAATKITYGNNCITAQRASEYGIALQAQDESDHAFRRRVSGVLRDSNHLIEAHEAATNRLYNDGGENSMEDPMTGIIGAIAQAMQGKNYNVSGADQVACDYAAGHIVKNPRKGAFDGMSPEMAILAATLFGGR
jgi:hypothetical protein